MIRKLGACLFTALLTGSTVTAKTVATPTLTGNLAPEPHLSKAVDHITGLMTNRHYKKTAVDDELSAQILERYVESLDPNRIFFLKSDLDSFNRYQHVLDDALAEQDLRPAYEIFNVYRRRVDQYVAYATALINEPFDFSRDESLELDRSEAPWVTSMEELQDIWRRRVKNDVLRLRLTDKERDAIVETLHDRYEGFQRRVSELDSEDVFQYYMNAFAMSIEPHTGYMAPRVSENFQIQMRLSLEGIGAVLERQNEYTTVRRVVTGGPAGRDGRLKVGDRIVGVAQGDSSELATDVIGWRLDDVVEQIRGKMGTMVHLDIIPADSPLDSMPVTISLLRDKVKLEEQAAQKSIYQLELDGRDYKIGVIDLPTFYLDFAGRNRNEEDYRSSTRDVRRLLRELRAADVDGVIVDLRNNGGGSLIEATTLTGLFIDEGPVVQIKDHNNPLRRAKVTVERDREEGVEWDGPLAVLVNRHSASASEIFAAAIQDYERGLIIGERTFGKGTVQNLINLDRARGRSEEKYGQVKLTVAQFFRISGGSTQHRGVIPEIAFPTLREDDEHGESSLDNALPWTSIKRADYRLQRQADLTSLLPTLSRRSAERLKDDEGFRLLLDDIKRYREARDETTVSLLESERRAKQKTEDERREARKQAREAANQDPADVVLLHSDEERFASVNDEPDSEEGEADEGNEGDANERNDVLLDETIRVLGDMIVLSDPTRRTAFVESSSDTIN